MANGSVAELQPVANSATTSTQTISEPSRAQTFNVPPESWGRYFGSALTMSIKTLESIAVVVMQSPLFYSSHVYSSQVSDRSQLTHNLIGVSTTQVNNPVNPLSINS